MTSIFFGPCIIDVKDFFFQISDHLLHLMVLVPLIIDDKGVKQAGAKHVGAGIKGQISVLDFFSFGCLPIAEHACTEIMISNSIWTASMISRNNMP